MGAIARGHNFCLILADVLFDKVLAHQILFFNDIAINQNELNILADNRFANTVINGFNQFR